MPDLSTWLQGIREQVAKATPPDGFCETHKLCAKLCPMCAAALYPDLTRALALLDAMQQMVEAIKNVLLVSSKEPRTRLDGSKIYFIECAIQEFEQLQDALTAYAQTVRETVGESC